MVKRVLAVGRFGFVGLFHARSIAMRTWILMLCGVSISCLAPSVGAVDSAPANLGDGVARSADAGGNSLAGCWHVEKVKYNRKHEVVVPLRGLHKDHNHWVNLIDKKGNVVAERLILPEEPRDITIIFKDVDCDGARHTVKVWGEGGCKKKKRVRRRCRK